ncbi:hypothetical membrane protein [Thermococcus kodakarensis KOD1]|uniref:Hypothetical membrane protein n=1 Tax=Thermococcus kodakarensis (strain ATCC BAA-918 / JCM 12380 / KOD1) TaxID=69014 RepID=Q5JFY1_THEKO|nr:hypothetical membrane protein [Thermococcus kodakarensis KOD1]
MPLLKIGFNLTVLLVAITSMVPLGEVAGTVYAKITGLHRIDGMIAVSIMTIFFGTLNVLLLSYNIDAVRILDKTVAVLLFFGTVIEAFGIMRSNVSPIWKYSGYIVSWIVGLFGVYYLAVSIKEHNYVSIIVVLAIFLLVIASNKPIKNRMRITRRRQYFNYR